MNINSVHIDWVGSLLIVGAYQGFITALLLWFRRKGKKVSNRILGGICLGMALGMTQAIIILSDNISPTWALSWTMGSAPFLYGPAIYFYIRTYINRDFRFQRIHLLHLIPYVSALIFRIVYQSMGGESIFEQYEAIRQGNPPPVFRIIGTALMTHILSYLFFSLRLVSRYRRFVRTTSSFEEQSSLRWISWITLILLFPLLTAIFSAIILGPIQQYPAPGIAAIGMISMLSLIYLIRPEVLDGVGPELAIETESELEAERYVSSSLADKQKQQYSEQLLKYMEEQQAYRSQNLTLSELAESLKINSKYLSQVINELHGLNFMDFINGYRIRAAQEMLVSPRFKHYTIVAIANEVGFRSRSAFYSAFKKVTGQTPTEFKNA
ncbi:MAG: helix-turn-helix domain-containing protein [Bacteroidota bacterium]